VPAETEIPSAYGYASAKRAGSFAPKRISVEEGFQFLGGAWYFDWGALVILFCSIVNAPTSARLSSSTSPVFQTSSLQQHLQRHRIQQYANYWRRPISDDHNLRSWSPRDQHLTLSQRRPTFGCRTKDFESSRSLRRSTKTNEIKEQ
jgi:hypothetical protein